MSSAMSVDRGGTKKRAFVPHGVVAPASFPRTGRFAEQMISDEERSQLAQLARSLDFDAEDDGAGQPQPQPHSDPLPLGVSQTPSGAFRYEEPSTAAGNEDIQDLEAQLQYFQQMRAQAESLASQFGAPVNEGSTAGTQEEQLAQLMSRKNDLDALQQQLTVMRQAQEGIDGELDAGPPPNAPPQPPPAQEVNTQAAMLADLDQKNALLEALQGQLESLHDGLGGDSNALAELHAKRATLDKLRNQLAQFESRPAPPKHAAPPRPPPSAQVSFAVPESSDDDVSANDPTLFIRQQLANIASMAQIPPQPTEYSSMEDAQAHLRELEEKKAVLNGLRSQLNSLTALAQQAETEEDQHSPNKIEVIPEEAPAQLSAVAGEQAELQQKLAMLEGLRSQLQQLRDGQDSTDEVHHGDEEAALADLRQRKAMLEGLSGQLAQFRDGSGELPFSEDGEENTDSDGAGAAQDSEAAALADLEQKKAMLAGLQDQLAMLKKYAAAHADTEPQGEMSLPEQPDYVAEHDSEEEWMPSAADLAANKNVQDLQEKESMLEALAAQLTILKTAAEESQEVPEEDAGPNTDEQAQPAELDEEKAMLQRLQAQIALLRGAAAQAQVQEEQEQEQGPEEEPASAAEAAALADLEQKRALLHRLQGQLADLKGTADQSATAQMSVSEPELDDGERQALEDLQQKKAMLERVQDQLAMLKAGAHAPVDPEASPAERERAALADLQKKKALLESLQGQLVAFKGGDGEFVELPEDQDISMQDDTLSHLRQMRAALIEKRNKLAQLKQAQDKLSNPGARKLSPVAQSPSPSAPAPPAETPQTAKLQTALSQIRSFMMHNDLTPKAQAASTPDELENLHDQHSRLETLRMRLGQMSHENTEAVPEEEGSDGDAYTSEQNEQLAQLQSKQQELSRLQLQLSSLRDEQDTLRMQADEAEALADENNAAMAEQGGDEEDVERDEAILARLLKERSMLQTMLTNLKSPGGDDSHVEGARENYQPLDEDDKDQAVMDAELAELRQTRSALEAMKQDLLQLKNAGNAGEDIAASDDDLEPELSPADMVRQRLESLRALAPPTRNSEEAYSQVSTRGSMDGGEPDEPDFEEPPPNDQLLPRLQSLMDEMRKQQFMAQTSGSARQAELDAVSMVRSYSQDNLVATETASTSGLGKLAFNTSYMDDAASMMPDDGSIIRDDTMSKSSIATGAGRPPRSVGFSEGSSKGDDADLDMRRELLDLRKQVGLLTEFVQRGPMSATFEPEPAMLRESPMDEPVETNQTLHVTIPRYSHLKAEVDTVSNLRAYSDAGGLDEVSDEESDEEPDGADPAPYAEVLTNRGTPTITISGDPARNSTTGSPGSVNYDQNLKLASLYVEALPIDRRQDFLTSFFSYQNSSTTADQAFMHSFEKYRSMENSGSVMAHDGSVAPSDLGMDRMDSFPPEPEPVTDGDTDGGDESVTDFDLMKDSIYREVAVFIACNELRPNFLVSFFRIVQCLTTDLLRDEAINALQDLLISAAPAADDTKEVPEIADVATRFDDSLNLSLGANIGNESYLGNASMLEQEFGTKLLAHLETDDDDTAGRPNSTEHRDRSYDYEETALSATDVPTPGGSSHDEETDNFGAFGIPEGAMEQLTVNEGLAMEFQTEIEGNKEVVLQLSRQLDKMTGESFTDENVGDLVTLVVELIGQSSQATGSGSNSGVVPQLSKAVQKVLQRSVGKPISDCAEDVLRSVSDILYDVMIFNKVIQQVDKSYMEEITELQSTQNHLDLEVHQLQHQREEDLARLMTERLDRLGKMRWGAGDDDGLDDERDDEFANQFDVGNDASMLSSSVMVELTPAEARLPSDPDEDEDQITLDDIPDRITVDGPSSASKATPSMKAKNPQQATTNLALQHLESLSVEATLAGDDSAPVPGAGAVDA